MTEIDRLPIFYIMKINDYFYCIDENGRIIFTHSLNQNNNIEQSLWDYCNLYCKIIWLKETPEDLEIWDNLIKLNRSLMPKE